MAHRRRSGGRQHRGWREPQASRQQPPSRPEAETLPGLNRRGRHCLAQPARRASLIFHLPLGKEGDQSRAGDQHDEGDCNTNHNHLRFLCLGSSQSGCSSGPIRVPGSVTLTIALMSNVQCITNLRLGWDIPNEKCTILRHFSLHKRSQAP